MRDPFNAATRDDVGQAGADGGFPSGNDTPNLTLGLALKHINDELFKKGNTSMNRYGLTLSQAHVLLFLEEKGKKNDVSFKDLERNFCVAQASMAGVIARLEEKGFVSTRQNPADRRAKLVSMNRSGKQVCEYVRDGISTMDHAMTVGFTEYERKELLDLLKRVYINVCEADVPC